MGGNDAASRRGPATLPTLTPCSLRANHRGQKDAFLSGAAGGHPYDEDPPSDEEASDGEGRPHYGDMARPDGEALYASVPEEDETYTYTPALISRPECAAVMRNAFCEHVLEVMDQVAHPCRPLWRPKQTSEGVYQDITPGKSPLNAIPASGESRASR